MSKIKKRMLTAFIVLLVLAVGTAVYAAPMAVKLTAYQGIKIFYNGTQLSGTDQPYLINNRTYVPLRLLMDNFGKNIGWDGANNQVIISDNGSSVNDLQQLQSEIASLQKKNSELQNTITKLNAKVAKYEGDEGSNASLSDIKSELVDYFEDAGSDYFSDSGIDFTFSLTGDEDEISYTIRMDFDDADDYSDLSDVSITDIEEFLDDVEAKISSEADNTDYEDADISGKLVDSDDSSLYVRSDDGDYTYSWDEDDTSLDDIEEAVADYLYDYGSNYFDDDVSLDVSLSGDRDDIEYELTIDCSGTVYADISEIGSSKIKTVMNLVKSRIVKEADGTSFEDADITGIAVDADDSSIYVRYNGSTYSYHWD